MKLSEYIDEMNVNGQLDYADYSNLRDMADELEAENAELKARLEKAVILPFFQKDGEVIVLIYKNKDGIVLIEKYIEDEYYNGKRGKEAAEARLAELKGDKKE